MEKIELVDADGKPTGEVRWVEHPDQGFKGFLKWLVQNNSSAWVALMRSLIPHQVNLRTEKVEPVKYRSAEEIDADLRAAGFSDEKIAFLIKMLKFLYRQPHV